MRPAQALAARLENGSVMTRDEFHAVYEEFDELHGAELIESVVYLPAPIQAVHGMAHGVLLLWLCTYALERPTVVAHGPVTLFLDQQNEIEPDAMLVRRGPGWLTVDSCVAKTPELVAEVARNSGSRELNQKKRAYERNGVREYIVWRTHDDVIDWFELRDGVFVLRAPDASGLIESRQFPGLVMEVPAMLAMDRPKVLAALTP